MAEVSFSRYVRHRGIRLNAGVDNTDTSALEKLVRSAVMAVYCLSYYGRK